MLLACDGKIGRPKRRWLDSVRGYIKENGLSGEEVYDRATWRRMSSYIDPTQTWEYDKRKKKPVFLFNTAIFLLHWYIVQLYLHLGSLCFSRFMFPSTRRSFPR